MKALYTIGYEGANLADFIETLRMADVDLLLDIREFPGSRRRGFSKTALSEALEAVGIEYQHERVLGSPKELRHKLRADGDYEFFFRGFREYLDAHRGLLIELSDDLQGAVVLMCYERDSRTCHRRVVAEEIGKIASVTPKHIGVAKDAARKSEKEAGLRPR